MQNTTLSPDFVALLLGSQTILLSIVGFFLVRFFQQAATKADMARTKAELELEMAEQCSDIMREIKAEYQTKAFCDERSRHYGGRE